MVKVSTFYDSTYDRSNFVPNVSVNIGKGKQVVGLTLKDRLNNSYFKVIDNCTILDYYVWQEGDNLPNLSVTYYGTSTAWWIIARKNGVIDPLNLKVGDTLQIPDLSSILTELGDTSTSELNTEVTF
jgi:nucleoid-associated protein YgaU